MGALAWRDAWHQALYGSGGFYRADAGPAGHFTTATHGVLGARLAGALARLARERGLTHIVDIGAGRGELLTQLRSVDAGLQLTGVDVVERPARLPDDVEWATAPGGAELPDSLDRLRGVLVLAHEWLDVVPCDIAEVDPAGILRHRTVDPATGAEDWGAPLDGPALTWTQRYWPATAPGTRVEVGLSRDAAWGNLLARIGQGLAIAVDYGHRGGTRPSEGTLTAYRKGTQVTPVPDGSCDLTAHVAMDSLDHDDLVDQRTALRSLGIDGATPPHALALSDPTRYVLELQRASADAALTARGGFGDYLWAVRRVG